MPDTFRVGVTSDILDSRGEPAFGREPLKALDQVQWEWLPKGLREITADLAATYDALARIRNFPTPALADLLAQNFTRLFGPPLQPKIQNSKP